VNRLNKIQQQGLKFLSNEKRIQESLKIARDAHLYQCITSLILRAEDYRLVTCAISERKDLTTYFSYDYSYAEVIIPHTSNNEAIAKLKFEIEHLICRATDNPDCEPIIEHSDLSIYWIPLSGANCFLLWEIDKPCKVISAPETEKLLLTEVESNRGYAIEAAKALSKYFGHPNKLNPCKFIFRVYAGSTYMLYKSHLAKYFVVDNSPNRLRYLTHFKDSQATLTWLESTCKLNLLTNKGPEGVIFDKVEYDHVRERLQFEIKAYSVVFTHTYDRGYIVVYGNGVYMIEDYDYQHNHENKDEISAYVAWLLISGKQTPDGSMEAIYYSEPHNYLLERLGDWDRAEALMISFIPELLDTRIIKETDSYKLLERQGFYYLTDLTTGKTSEIGRQVAIKLGANPND
jgi:hypothetical protein